MGPQPHLTPKPAPFLLRPPASAQRYTPLALWHLLSLDAPTVAALWTWFVARCCGLRLPLGSASAMFLAVWMLYVADRLLDARPVAGTPAGLEERHRFHDRHRKPLLVLCAATSVALAALMHFALPEAVHLYTLLAVLLAGYLVVIHARSSASAHRLPKELAVGIFFPAAVFIPTVARLPAMRLALLGPALLFACVCTLNCLCVYAWEHAFDTRSAHWTTDWGTRHLQTLIAVIAALSVTASASLLHSKTPHLSAIPLACALSSLLLLALDRTRHSFTRVHLRALADLVLLSPLLVLPFFLAR